MKEPFLKEQIRAQEHYEPCDKKDVQEWIEEALHSEMGYWEKQVPIWKAKGDNCLSKRDFHYSYNEEIEFRNDDIILDVGCGPLPKFGNMMNGKEIKYVPVDPLAYQYQKIIHKNGIKLPVEPSFAIMEALTNFYNKNSADYVIVNNALDHSIDIMRAFIECLQVVKIGGVSFAGTHGG